MTKNQHVVEKEKERLKRWKNGCPLSECVSLQRLTKVLSAFHSKFPEISEKWMLQKEEILNDYHHILSVHLNEDAVCSEESDSNFLFISNLMTDCKLSECHIFAANHRERERQRVCESTKDGKVAMMMDLMGSMHSHFVHSIRPLIEDEDEENEDKERNMNRCHDREIRKMKERKTNNSGIRGIRGSDRLKNNKFVTNFEDETEEKEEKDEEKEVDIDYSFGHSLDYWSPSRRSKYHSLKEELTTNNIFCVEMECFDAALQKALFLLETSDHIKGIKKRYDNVTEHYGIKNGCPLSPDHVLSVVIYTDYDVLSGHFSKTFRSKQKENREYFILSKLLTESVNAFGTKMADSKIPVLYHGVSMVYFDKFIARFYCPTSTTTKLVVAYNFTGNDGIILELQREYEWLRYLDCSFFSAFANEDERLFIQPPAS